MNRRLVVLFGLFLLVPGWAPSASAGDPVEVTADDYARAEQFLGWNIDSLIFELAVQPNWIEGSDRFWYRNDTRDGKQFVLVDPARKRKAPAFDHARLAAALSTAQADAATSSTSESPSPPTAVDPENLPFDTFEYTGDGGAITFTVAQTSWTCDLSRYVCTGEPAAPPVPYELVSPDGKLALYAEDDNLWVRPLGESGGEPRQLTHDGEPHFAYGAEPEGRTTAILEKQYGIRRPPSALWSPDGKRIFTQKLDEREVGEFHLVQGVPPEGRHRPIHYSYRMAIPGDAAYPEASLVVIDVSSGDKTAIDFEPLLTDYVSAFTSKEVWWGPDGGTLYFIIRDRGDRRARLVAADPGTGGTRVIIDERSATHLDLSPDIYTMMMVGPTIRVLSQRRQVIWFSERDGWGHLYLYDLATGELKNQITRGPWLVRGLVRVDEAAGRIWFVAGGREPGRDPYLRHLYSINLDGSDLRLLSPEDADHDIHPSPSGTFFVDNFSRIDLAPASVLRSADGRVVLELEKADIEKLLATGWQLPERFTVKAADGVTDIYGILIKPIGFDPGKAYPVLDDIYPGPQVIRVPKAFPPRPPFPWGDDQALAELGFVVFMVDGRGTPMRSKAFHDDSYRNLQSAGGLEDHIAALEQLAIDHPYLDLDRVGIFGWSGGGFASVRAMLAYPDFYRVAVSGAGNHDQRSYVAGWGEKYHGLVSDTDYQAQANESLAANLKGKLLLVMPELDDNVNPTNTVQLIDALIKANKDFDLLLLPGEHHGPMATTAYLTRRRWDYFVRNLLGTEPPGGYEVAPPPPEYFRRNLR